MRERRLPAVSDMEDTDGSDDRIERLANPSIRVIRCSKERRSPAFPDVDSGDLVFDMLDVVTYT